MSGLIDFVVDALEDVAKAGVMLCSGMLVLRILGQFFWGW